MDYKNTLNLPSTDFPMKANLKTTEEKFLKEWSILPATLSMPNWYESAQELSKVGCRPLSLVRPSFVT